MPTSKISKSSKNSYYKIKITMVPLKLIESEIRILNTVNDYFDLSYKYELTLDLLKMNPLKSYIASEIDEYLYYREETEDFLKSLSNFNLSKIEKEAIKECLSLNPSNFKEGGYHRYITSEDFMDLITDIEIFELTPEMFKLEVIIRDFNKIDLENFISDFEKQEITYSIEEAVPNFTFDYNDIMREERELGLIRSNMVMQRRYEFFKENK